MRIMPYRLSVIRVGLLAFAKAVRGLQLNNAVQLLCYLFQHDNYSLRKNFLLRSSVI
jgi:hypothetical protein